MASINQDNFTVSKFETFDPPSAQTQIFQV